MLSILEFISLYKSSDATRAGYRVALCLFLEMLYKIEHTGHRSDEHVQRMDEISVQYLSEQRDHFRDLIKFSNYLNQYTPCTSYGYLARVRYWLEMNDIVFPASKAGFLKRNAAPRKPATEDRPMSNDDVKRWHMHLSRLGQVLLLVQMSSGMRVGELVSLLPEDVDLSSSPVEITISKSRQNSGTTKSTKNNEPRYTFMSQEAAYAVREWLTVRDAWLLSASKKHVFGEKPIDDNRLFPVAKATVQSIYIRGLQKAGLYEVDAKTNRATITSHSLRKFFLSQMKTAMPGEMVEMLAGHSGYLSDAYRRYPKDQVREAYLNAEYTVCLNAPIDAKQMKDTSDKLNAVTSEYIRLKGQVDAQQSMMDRIVQLSKFMDENEDKIKKIK